MNENNELNESCEVDSLFEEKVQLEIKQKIVEELLNTTKNLETKTELPKPIIWSCLDTIKVDLEIQNLPKSSKMIQHFQSKSYELLISKDRKGRKEYIEALHALGLIEQKEEDKLKEKKFLQ